MTPQLLAVIASLVVSCGVAPKGSSTPQPAIAMMGQSNSVGAAQASDLPAPLQANFSQIPYAYNVMNTAPGPFIGPWGALRVRGTLHGAEITLGRALAAAGSTPWVYKVATAAQASQYFIDNWPTTVSQLNAARASAGTTIAFGTLVWQQGEGDCANTTLASNYANQLTTIASLWRSYTGNPNAKIVIVEIAHNMTAAGVTEWPTVAAQQASFVAGDAHSALVPWRSAWTINPADGIHYDSAGQQAIGNDAAPFI